ncbi:MULTISPECIES: nitroreductase family deazaflavin-dependent oxidoreductase [Streptomyces]|uniref:Nitroreductase family deazaflavin-dependent oxidoreductase n=1 Tax=Streptomyces tendae TaxID=1932 RepID=A0A6B3Q9I6_STRTE|nr:MULTISPECIES: nitroreductase family deazaflavin-dependent oxidoreductase [Streptomyces]MBQ0965051.1 nitroreductase family deazaflavin-dependent oxidoreductase [Streptomyces sp. RK74B]MBQ1006281.1 nitroreductase family deazaflavin-dependent oxidoreductase [Streptomyces sp. RK23]NEV85236.1 nitroreductase family deazaflavin-dependent oxidoreductase [Streptomyces tendae]BET46543.1 nitroreductase family deazaflavin-dependent oxidoreductase [Kitasatospora aureofaciens]
MTPDETDPARPAVPTGWRRLIARAPIFMFRTGLGPLLGRRLLLLHHVGRVSGSDRRVVLEVVAYEAPYRCWTVASGFGPRSDWYRNLRDQPKTVVQFGNRHHAVTAHFLTPDEGADIMTRYGRRHPRTARRLCAYLGLPADGTESALREAGRTIPFVRLETDTCPPDAPRRHETPTPRK